MTEQREDLSDLDALENRTFMDEEEDELLPLPMGEEFRSKLAQRCQECGLNESQVAAYLKSFESDVANRPKGQPVNLKEAIADTGVQLAVLFAAGKVEIAQGERLYPAQWNWKATPHEPPT